MTPAATPTDTLAGAACRAPDVDPAIFFPPEQPRGYHGPAWDPRPALAVCARCECVEACYRRAVEAGDIYDGVAVHGVIGGLAPPRRPKGERAQRSMHSCELASCRRLFLGNGRDRYCSTECFRAARALTQRERRAG